MTLRAVLNTRNLYSLLAALRSLLKGDCNGALNIPALARSVRIARAAEAAATAEKRRKDVAEVNVALKASETAAEAARACACAEIRVNACETKLVIARFLFGVGKYLVRLVALLELCLCFGVVGIEVGVVFLCRLSFWLQY